MYANDDDNECYTNLFYLSSFMNKHGCAQTFCSLWAHQLREEDKIENRKQKIAEADILFLR